MPIPTFFLYGEPNTHNAANLLHVELLDERSRPANWTIHPHLHADLHHLILIVNGGGTIHAEGQDIAFQAPCLIVMPAGVLHGFRWAPESRGHVLSVGDARIAALASHDPDISSLFAAARAIAVADGAGGLERQFRQLTSLLATPSPGSRSRIEAHLLLILAEGISRASLSNLPHPLPARQIGLVRRLRDRIDQRFHLREPVQAHAAALGTSETALRLACQAVAGIAPAAMLDRRAVLEAQRLLLNTSLAIAEIAEAAGFADPAYFTRFFRRHTGVTPRAFRRAHHNQLIRSPSASRPDRSFPS